jgi:hypothetical protein
MGRQIIKQPNGKYAQWSSIVDDFVMLDASPENIIEDWVDDARKRITDDVRRIVDELDTDERPYHQFTMSWDDALARIRSVHGSASETWGILKELNL